MENERKFETLAIRNQLKRSGNNEHTTPIYATSSFVFNDSEAARAAFAAESEDYIYTRLSNPNNDEFIKKMCLLESAESGCAFASGMSAVFASMAPFLRAGDHVLANSNLFASTYSILTKIFPQWAISHSFFRADEVNELEELIMPNTKIIYIETPSNPMIDIIDIEKVAKIAKDNQVLLIVDNCFATPYIQNPIVHGADIVCHSATKFIDGQGRVLGGAVLGKKSLIDEVANFSGATGPTLSPFNSWILSKSLETLAVRMDRHSENAFKVASFLESHEKVNIVKYPFLPNFEQFELARKQMRLGGALLSFEVKGGVEAAKKFIDNLELLSITSNLGDTRTTVTHPATTTHSKLTQEEREESGITDGFIRMSIGLEHLDDIIKDIDKALAVS